MPWTPPVARKSRQQSSDTSSESGSSEHADVPTSNRAGKGARENQEKEPNNFASAYHRAQHELSHGVTQKPKNPVFAYGDPLLPEPELSYFVLPPLDEARNLVAKFFEVVTPNMRIFHQPTVDKWLLDVIQNFKGGLHVDNARSAIILLILALSYNYTDMSSEEEDANMRYDRALTSGY